MIRHPIKTMGEYDGAKEDWSDNAGELLVKIVQGGKLPKRLPLGSDTVRIIENELQRRIEELETEDYSIKG